MAKIDQVNGTVMATAADVSEVGNGEKELVKPTSKDPPRPKRDMKQLMRRLRLTGRLARTMRQLSQEAPASELHVWVHREADTHLAPFSFGKYIAKTLQSFGAEAKAEEDGEDMASATICIFLLSNFIFADQRSIALMRRAVELGKQCLLINMYASLPLLPTCTSAQRPHTHADCDACDSQAWSQVRPGRRQTIPRELVQPQLVATLPRAQASFR